MHADKYSDSILYIKFCMLYSENCNMHSKIAICRSKTKKVIAGTPPPLIRYLSEKLFEVRKHGLTTAGKEKFFWGKTVSLTDQQPSLDA